MGTSERVARLANQARFRGAGHGRAARLASAALLALGGLTGLSGGIAHAASFTVTDCVGTSGASLGGILASNPTGAVSITFDCHDTAANGSGPYSIVIPSQTVVGAGRSVTIDGADVDARGARYYGITLQVPTGLPNGRAFVVSGGGSLTLKNLVLQGAATGATTPSDQAGVEITGTSTFAASNVEFLNLFGFLGGAVYLHPSSADSGSPSATIRNSSFVGDFAVFGGAILAGGSSVFGAASAATGSKVVQNATLTSSLIVINSSFNGNLAIGGGGAIYADAGSTVALSSDTVAGDAAIFIGGGGIASGTAAANFVVRNTIIASNAPDNCAGFITPIGANLEYPVGTQSCGFSVTGDPLLTFVPNPVTLSSSPGLVTPYWKLGAGSPAIDASTDCTDGATALTTDQIGDPRPSGPACDIGAYEVPLQQTATSCSLRIGFFANAGTTQFSLATGNLDNTAAGGKRTLINYISLHGSEGLLRAIPVTSSVTCLLAATVAGVRLPLQVDLDAMVYASSVPGIVLVPNAPLPRIHVTIRQDLGTSPPVESVTITNSVVPGTAGPITYYSFDPSNTSIAPRSFAIRAVYGGR